MAGALDLPDDCWQPPSATDVPVVGALYEGVPLPSLDEFQILVREETREFWIPMRFTFAVVVRASSGFVTLVPVTTGSDVSDSTQFDWLIEQGRTAAEFVRLPECSNAWQGDALTLLIQPQTLPVAELSQPPAELLATMTAEAQETFRHRVANAWSG